MCNHLYFECIGRRNKYLEFVTKLNKDVLAYADKTITSEQINNILSDIEKNNNHKTVLDQKIIGLIRACSILKKIISKITSKTDDGFKEAKSRTSGKKIEPRQITDLISKIDLLVQLYNTDLLDTKMAKGNKIQKTLKHIHQQSKNQRTKTKPETKIIMC